jgi:hypothetical protein
VGIAEWHEGVGEGERKGIGARHREGVSALCAAADGGGVYVDIQGGGKKAVGEGGIAGWRAGNKLAVMGAWQGVTAWSLAQCSF